MERRCDFYPRFKNRLTEGPAWDWHARFDTYLRRQKLRVGGAGGSREAAGALPCFALAVVAEAQEAADDWASPTARLQFDGQPIPLDDDAALLVNYVGPTGSIPSVSFNEVVASGDDGANLWSTTTGATALECNGERTLQNGVECYWTVTAALSDGTFHRAYAGKFSMATAEQHAAARQVRALTAEAETPYSVLAAIWYIENGFIAEAIETAECLADAAATADTDTATTAGQETLVHRRLHRLYTLAGRHDDVREVLALSISERLK